MEPKSSIKLSCDQYTDSRKEQTMKQRLYRFRALAAVLAALTMSAPATAREQVPFKGQSSGVATTVGFDPVAGIVYVHGEATGTATHLGYFTFTGNVEIHLSAGNPFGIVLGTATITAANGDKLFLTSGGVGIDTTHGLGTFTVVGGTGRFQGATGTYQQIITFAATGIVEGSIAYTEVLEGTISSGGQ
jgi:hypothetical protein